ncbi:ChrR family anti-sigma-E factor [Pseudoxanthomonas sp. Root630]|uniref:ChrR family anti-sigma-E factor n=1 Tax=Pseudoxanthomonas sp. Root630 TaxID=1736574 RepID=UPI000702FF8E|nr:ChrR family anti-sigma-E factor [Pseudoxanthomonas sp. Root630]KRA48747.1 transcriptional regulator [Pseudoxanthomonas sp. Root630]
MNPHHHLDPSTVVSYAAGALAVEVAVVAATHLETCAHCRARLQEAERIGGQLVEYQQPALPATARLAGLRAAMLEHLDAPLPPPVAPMPKAAPYEDDDRLPAPLHPYFGASYRALKWRWMAPGVHCIRARGTTSGTLLMLKIGPGRSMPVHSHGGTELTQILRGAYHDALGHFAPGDAADLDSDVEHQPVTVPGTACICVSALDAPLRFPGWLARRLQPLFKL